MAGGGEFDTDKITSAAVLRQAVKKAPFLPYSEKSGVCRLHRKNSENPALISTIISLHIRYLETGEEMATVKRNLCV